MPDPQSAPADTTGAAGALATSAAGAGGGAGESAQPLIAEADCFACQRRPSDRGRTRVNVSKTV